MYDPPGTHGYNGGLTLREARSADAAIKKRDQDKKDIKEGKVNENTSTQHIPVNKKGSTSKSFLKSVVSFGNKSKFNLSSIAPVGGTRRRRKNRKKSSAKLRKKARSYRK